jgi:hypothetical protein
MNSISPIDDAGPRGAEIPSANMSKGLARRLRLGQGALVGGFSIPGVAPLARR